MDKKIDLLLVIAQQPRTAKFLSLSSGVTPPLGAAYLASYLKKHGFNIAILDNDIEKLNKRKFSILIHKLKPTAVGFSTFTNSFNNALAIASIVKEVDTRIKVIMGGAHASALPREVLRYKDVDIVVKGEGEITLLELLRCLDGGGNPQNVKGVLYKDGDCIIENPDRGFIKEIDELPFPAYHLLPMKQYYLPASRRMATGRISAIITGRGCPYRCTFCSRSVFGRSARLRSPGNVVEEMKYLVRYFCVKEFLIWDDVFTLDADRAIEICHLLKKENLNISWSCSSRVDRASDVLYQELASAGCKEILLGIESGSQAILDALRKDITISQAQESVRLCKKYKIRAFCTFVMGSPFETKETLIQTLNFVKELDPHYALFCLLVPLPGSQLFEEIVIRPSLDLTRVNWDDFLSVLSAAPPPLQLGSFEKKELVQWQKKIFREFYFRPKYIMRHLLGLRSLEHVYESLRGVIALVGHQLNRFCFEKNEN